MKIPPLVGSAIWIVVLLAVAWALRAPFLHREMWNLDEGATFIMAEQVLHGDVMYRDAVDHRSPLVPYLMAAVFAVAGEWNVYAQHLTLALAMGLCAFGLFALSSQLGHRAVGRWSAVAFTVVILLLPGLGDALGIHTESFVIFFSTLGFYLFTRALSSGGFLAGLSVGLAFGAGTLCKQPGLLDFGVTWVILGLAAWRDPVHRLRYARLFGGAIAGFAAIFSVACIYFWAHGVWDDFLYYCWTYNTRFYVPEVPFAMRLAMADNAWNAALTNVPIAIALGIPGLIMALIKVGSAFVRRSQPMPILPLLVLGWTSTGVISTALSGRDFAHYVIQVAPGLSLACGLMAAQIADWLTRTDRRRLASGWVGCALVLWTLHDVHSFRQQLNPRDEPSKIPLRTLVQRYTEPSDRIFIWGYFPDGYVIAQRLPATRFIYSNFLTGLIPWTNVRADIDTSYAIVPGAWDAFWRDYTESRPRLIINSPIRNYSKYPLLAQPKLSDEVIDHFVELHPTEMDSNDGKVLLRLSEPNSELGSATPPVDESIALHVIRAPTRTDLLLVTVSAPEGTTGLTLRLGGRPYRSFQPRSDKPIEARFMVRIADLAPRGASTVDAVAERNGSLAASKPIDVVRHLVLNVRSVEPTPVLLYSTQLVTPQPLPNPADWHGELVENLAGWRHAGPFTLAFQRPREMQVLQFAWRADPLDPESIPEVVFQANGLEPQSLEPDISPGPAGTSNVVAKLPEVEGKFLVRWLKSNTAWIGNIRGSAFGPSLQFGTVRIDPSAAAQLEGQSLNILPDGSWDVRAPSRIVYPREPGMEAIVVKFGLHENSDLAVPDVPAAKAKFEVNFLHEDGRMTNLHSRTLEPRLIATDRGAQTATVALPPSALGEVELKFTPLTPADTNNRSYLFPPRAMGSGPDIAISPERILVPLESQYFGGERIHQYVGTAWFAHAPSRVVYDCPEDLRAITFGFELPKDAYSGEPGKGRSDGIGAIVEFDDGAGTITQLYHRNINPASVPDDRGRLYARVELPGRRGRLVIRLTAGPNNDSSFDWSYLMQITGEVASDNPTR